MKMDNKYDNSLRVMNVRLSWIMARLCGNPWDRPQCVIPSQTIVMESTIIDGHHVIATTVLDNIGRLQYAHDLDLDEAS